MPTGQIIIHEQYCKGCGYCEFFCPQSCIVTTGKKVSPEGYLLPTFYHQDDCKGCGICSQMCPEFAIEVFQIKGEKEGEKKTRKVKRRKIIHGENIYPRK